MSQAPPPQFPGQPAPQVVYVEKKRRRKWPWVLLVLVVLIVIISVASNSGSSDGPKVVSTSGVPSASSNAGGDQKEAPAIGTTLEVSDLGDTAQVTVANLREGTPSQFASPKGTIYVVDVTIQATKGKWEVNPLYFSASTQDGTHLETSLGGSDGQIESGSVPAGQKVSGEVAFDVPQGQTLRDVAIDGPLGKSLATWVAR